MNYHTQNTKLRLRFNTDGHTGVGRALCNLRSTINFNLFVRTPYSRIVDDGQIITTAPVYPTHDYMRTLLMSECIIILYQSTLPDRLRVAYKQARKNRKSAWLIDMDIQPPEEMTNIFNQSYLKHYWTNNVTVLGPTESECPNIYHTTMQFFSSFLSRLNV